jgi:hypothetical protein
VSKLVDSYGLDEIDEPTQMTAEEFAGLRKRLEIAEQKLALIDAKHEPLTPDESALGQKVADRIEREHALIVAAGGTHKSLSDRERSLKQAIADLGALERIRGHAALATVLDALEDEREHPAVSGEHIELATALITLLETKS